MTDLLDLGNIDVEDNVMDGTTDQDGVAFANDPGVLSDPFAGIQFPAATAADVWNPWDDHSMEKLRQELLPPKGA